MNDRVNEAQDSGEIWYLAQVKPNGDDLAIRNLLRQGFDVFAPKVSRTRRQRGQFRDVLQPLFPGYLFVRMRSHLSRWRAIASTLGIQRLVGFGDAEPSRVSRDLIESLKRRCNELGTLKTGTLAPGSGVRILSGPFAEFVGSVDRMPSERRIWILLDLVGRRIAVKPEQVELLAR